MEKYTSQKLLLDALGIFSVVGFVFAGYQIVKLVRDKKSEERKSNIGGKNLKTIVFTLTNDTNKIQIENLFNSRSGSDNPNVGITDNIRLFNEELHNMPKKVYKIEFRNVSGVVVPPPPPVPPIDPNLPAAVIAPADAAVIAPVPIPSVVGQNNQAEAPFKMNCKDASGNASIQQYIPLISVNQFQKGITTVKMNGRILDGECFMRYTMYPKSKVAIVVYYKDFPLSGLLGKKKEETKVNLELNNNINKSERKPLKAIMGLVVVGVVGYGAYTFLK